MAATIPALEPKAPLVRVPALAAVQHQAAEIVRLTLMTVRRAVISKAATLAALALGRAIAATEMAKRYFITKHYE